MGYEIKKLWAKPLKDGDAKPRICSRKAMIAGLPPLDELKSQGTAPCGLIDLLSLDLEKSIGSPGLQEEEKNG